MDAKIVQVGKQGNEVRGFAVTEHDTIQDLLEKAGLDDEQGIIYARKTGEKAVSVDRTDLVNGYDQVVITESVKGGNQ